MGLYLILLSRNAHVAPAVHGMAFACEERACSRAGWYTTCIESFWLHLTGRESGIIWT